MNLEVRELKQSLERRDAYILELEGKLALAQSGEAVAEVVGVDGYTGFIKPMCKLNSGAKLYSADTIATLTAELTSTRNELLREQEERKRAWEATECINTELATARDECEGLREVMTKAARMNMQARGPLEITDILHAALSAGEKT